MNFMFFRNMGKIILTKGTKEVSSKMEFEVKPRIASIIKEYESIYSNFIWWFGKT